MKAVILAAGIGSRLRPMTNNKPKTLVNVSNKPMLGYILDSLKSNKIKDAIVVIGFEAEKIVNYCKENFPDINFTFIDNPDFESTNNMYSLYLARNYLRDDLIIMNADLVFDAGIIKKLKKEPTSAVAVDKGNYIDESMKIIVKNNIVQEISKLIPPEKSYGCSIDIYKITKRDLVILKEEMKRIIEKENDLNQWTEVMLDNLFQSKKLIAKPCDIGRRKWFEIDNYADLARAEIIFNEKLKRIKNKKIFFIDRDGTLTLGTTMIPGALDFINKLREKKKLFYICTNNSSQTPFQHFRKLKKMGMKIKINNILVSTDAAITYLKRKKINSLYYVANRKVSDYLKTKFNYKEKSPQAILLSYDDEITYSKLKKLVELVRTGIPYYATHPDIVCPSENGFIPDIGTIIKIVEMTTGILPNKVFGKPDPSFIKEALKKHNLSFKDAAIIGDRLNTDIKMAKNCDLTSVLVLSGETKRDHYESSLIKGDVIIENIGVLAEYL